MGTESGRLTVAVPCEECEDNPAKYRCPACSFRSCSLTCVNSHKKRTGCSGKRNRTEFVPLPLFNDSVLLSDYNLLEEVKNVSESARRTRNKLCGYSHFGLPFHLRGLKNAAGSRKTKLLFLPSGMSKRSRNQSQYDPRKKSISWTIEWRFHSTKVVLHDNCVHEDAVLRTVILKHLQPGPWNHQLKEFCDERDNLKIFIRKFPKGPKSPYKELDLNASLRRQLANLVILEYPVIHVFLPTHSCPFEIIKDGALPSPKPVVKAEVDVDPSSAKGVWFKEEEINEDCNLESQDHGPRQNVNSLNTEPFPPHLTAGSGVSNVMSNGHSKLERNEEKEQSLDREMIKPSSDLSSEINPDDYLNWDCLDAWQDEVEEVSGVCHLLPGEDDLEDGEIPE
ncbi:hypothetical protein MLD38_022836 [Melastoma candidum]|uniref:Uncharacterized protein n=1 Tax=Melastoma candidum TaxID=119954 RepID=A0ACB9QP06_9MYRT|nr:hypothetical protein MLD38_022836 [Melastoma candidum]